MGNDVGLRILFDSKSEIHKKPFGCIKTDECVLMSIHIPDSCKTKKVFLKLEGEDGFALKVPFKRNGGYIDYEIYDVSFSLFCQGLYFYNFVIEAEESTFSLFRVDYDKTNMEEGEKWQLTCYDKNYVPPYDFYGRIFYQIFPDRFNIYGKELTEDKMKPFWVHDNKSDTPHYLPDINGKIINNDFYGGNLAGITEKLDYIKELGVGAIYLNPIFLAYSNHRYDTADYKKIDPMLGSEKDFVRLCDEAHNRDIKIILDGVFSHTGSDSIYFDRNNRFDTGILSNENSPYKNWFSKNPVTDDYSYWWDVDTLPCTNELDKSYMDYIIFGEDSVIAHWLNLGADGFRLDVADELPDEFIAAFHKRVKEIKPFAIVIGEVWEDASNKISYGKRRRYFADSELDSVMNYPFRNGIINYLNGGNADYFAKCINTLCENYPKPCVDSLLNSLSTHDTPRILTLLGSSSKYDKSIKAHKRLSEDELEIAIKKEKAAAFIQFILPGCPCIYYGDEAGLEGYEDPFNRRFFPWDNINHELLAFYKSLGKLKNSRKELKDGFTVASGENGILTIKRGSLTATVNLKDEIYPAEYGKIVFYGGCHEQNGRLVLCKYGFVLSE